MYKPDLKDFIVRERGRAVIIQRSNAVLPHATEEQYVFYIVLLDIKT